jgi:xylulokinase
MLPYLQGERTPVWNDRARGVFFGLDVSHGRGHLYRALVEGIALGFRDCLSVVEEQGVRFREVVANGGAGGSALLRQVLADALEVPLVWEEDNDGTVAGAAMLAAIGTGAIESGGSAWGRGTAATVRHEPDARASTKLREVFALRRALYEAVRTLRY